MSKTAISLEGHHLMQNCIEQCTTCHRVCLDTLKYGFRLGGRYIESVHLRLLLDCAEICQTSANFMLRGSDLHRQTCAACAVICQECAVDCERYTVSAEGSGAPMSRQSGPLAVSKENVDEQLKYCADICRQCAKSCREMAEMPLESET